LWNFLFRISSTDKEEKLQRSCFSWDSHYLNTPFNVSRIILSFLSPSGQFGLMSDDLPKVVNGNFLKHLHHFCILDDQGFSFLVLSLLGYCYNSFNLFSRSDAAEEKLAQMSSYLQDCLSKQLFIKKQKVTGQNVDIYTFQMILRFVVKTFEEENSLQFLLCCIRSRE
jgi:hypothetical protein